MKKQIILAFAFALQILLVLTYSHPVKANPEVDILSDTFFIDYSGYCHVVGEVENNGDQAIESVKITVEFYDSYDTMITSKFNYTYLNVLLPWRKSPFEIILSNAEQSEIVDHYTLSVSFLASQTLPMGLIILSDSWYVDGGGWLHVTGEIKNVLEQTATDIKIVATFYDDAGNVLDCESARSQPPVLTSNQSAPFEIILTMTGTVPLIATYDLTAESNEYAIVPEFSLITILPLLLILASIVITMKHLRNRRLKKESGMLRRRTQVKL